MARQVLAQAASTPGAISRTGVALAALTDLTGTVVQWPNRSSWAGLPFAPLLAAQLGLSVTVGDDANAATLAEWRYGSGQGARQMLLLIAGTGIGAGLILDQRLFLGRSSCAQSALADSGRWIGLATANMVNALGLEAVVIGGGLTTLGAHWWEPLAAAFEVNVLNQRYRPVALRPALFAREEIYGSTIASGGDRNAA